MLSLFIVLLSFSESWVIKNKFLNDEPWIARPILIDMGPAELEYYPFMITLKIFTGSCNAFFPKI